MGKKGIACAHILLCFAFLWQCRHKLHKIAQCLFFHVVVVCVFANSVVNCRLWRFSYLQLIMVRLAGAEHIVSPRAQLVLALIYGLDKKIIWVTKWNNNFKHFLYFSFHSFANLCKLCVPLPKLRVLLGHINTTLNETNERRTCLFTIRQQHHACPVPSSNY